MSENYYYSSLSGQEIEDTLVGAVVFNNSQSLTTSQKAQARQNIGAGEENTQIKIKGFYATLEDLQQAIPVGNEGDVYAVGTESPYDLYIWDAVNNVWVNNGPISFSDAIIDDNDVSTSSAWSSAKVTNELAAQKAEIDADVDAVTQSIDTVDASLSTYVRPNLLDNWYFVGGGSQLGHGVFPINQRGQTSYIGAVYGIDRWYSYQGSVTAVITSDGISITRSSGDFYSLVQKVKSPESLRGKTVTATLLAGGYNRVRLLANGTNIADSGGSATSDELKSITCVVPNDTTELLFVCYTSSAVTTIVKAAKLEIGNTQTLAHQKSGAWVLNEIPDYQAELTKCMAFFQRIGAFNNWKFYNCVVRATGSNGIICLTAIPIIPMRNTPTVTTSSTELQVVDYPGAPGTGTGTISGIYEVGYSRGDGLINIQFNCANSLAVGKVAYAFIGSNGSGSIDLSAE